MKYFLDTNILICLLIGANDLWIACHALAESAVLVTHNTREFTRVPGLSVEDWVGGS